MTIPGVRRHGVSICFTVGLLLTYGAGAASAGRVEVPCTRPFVYTEAAVNVVVLPFDAPAELRSSAIGRELARLVQLEALLSIAPFGSVGAVQLRGEGKACDPEDVRAKLLGELQGAETQLQHGHGLVLVWGRVFQSGQDLYLQTFIRFLRRGIADVVEVPVGGERLRARPSGDAFACVPRRIAVSDLANVHRQFERADVIFARPDAAAPKQPLPASAPFAYWITEIKGEWLRIQSPGGGLDGWLQASAPPGEWSLRALMPELSFVKGVAGYLRARTTDQPKIGPPPANTLAEADAAIAAYQQNWRKGALLPEGQETRAGFQPLAVAIPLQLRALIALMRGPADTRTFEAARTLLARAADLVPYSADARNFEVTVRLALGLAFRQPDVDPRQAIADLQGAAAAEPGNRLVLGNLAGALRLVLAADEGSPPGGARLAETEHAEMRRQADALAAMLKR